jgi:hypothetical protein
MKLIIVHNTYEKLYFPQALNREININPFNNKIASIKTYKNSKKEMMLKYKI